MKTNYKIQGAPNSPALVFSNSLGTDMQMWDEMTPFLLPYFRILRYDTRGSGQSEITRDPYTMEMLGNDVIDLLDKLGMDKVHFCGLSMGGLIGQWLGIHHPERLGKLVICNTAARIGEAGPWNERIKTIQKHGMEALAEGTMNIWFSRQFCQDQPARAEAMKALFLSNDVQGYANCCAAIRDADFRDNLDRISADTLVIAGDEDPVTTVAHAEFLAERIPNAQLQVLPARHLTSVEAPEAMAEILIDFLVGKTTFERGMHLRRSVLGHAHVDRANAGLNSFNADFQAFISQYAWGEIWTRPGLSRAERSLITIAMLIALNRQPELKMHIRASFNNGVSVAEIKEVILQSALYCGLPAANEAFHAAQEVFKELGLKL